MKNLKASEAVDCSTNFEILRYAQDDRERVFWMTVDSVWSARRSFATLRMTERVFWMTERVFWMTERVFWMTVDSE